MLKTALLGGVLAVMTLAAWPPNLTAESPKEPSKSNQALEGAKASSPITINLGDYAKGDGTDETAAIQKAFDALVALKGGWKPHIEVIRTGRRRAYSSSPRRPSSTGSRAPSR